MKVHTVGDSHLGRSFVNGVPLHRRGDREAMLWAVFEKEVRVPDMDLHVHLGDLFHAAVVPYDIILKTAELYDEVAKANPNCLYVILKGNHDYYRDLTRKSAFDLFTALVRHRVNIWAVDDTAVQHKGHVFVGYSIEHRIEDRIGKGHTLYCHCDVESFGGDGQNLVPIAKAAELGITKIITGHDHKRRTLTRDGVEVIVHGSLQPFAHGEESDDSLYVTLSLDELAAADPEYLRSRCVRVLGVPDEPVDVLQLTIKRPDSDKGDLPKVELGTFDMEALFRETFVEAGVPDNISEQVMLQYQTRRMNDA